MIEILKRDEIILMYSLMSNIFLGMVRIFERPLNYC